MLSCPGTIAGARSFRLISRGVVLLELASSPAGRCHADLADDSPYEGRELARDRSCDHRGLLTFSRQRAEPLAQPNLRLPGDLACSARCGGNPGLLLVSHPRWMPIGPSSLHQHTPGAAVASLGNRPSLDALPRRSLRWHQTQIGHQLARALE